MHAEVVYQNGGFTPAWSVPQWWLAGVGVPWQSVCVGGANVIDRRSVDCPLHSSRTPLTTIVIHSKDGQKPPFWYTIYADAYARRPRWLTHMCVCVFFTLY